MNRDELKEYFRNAYSGLLKEQDDPFATDDEGGDEGGDEEENVLFAKVFAKQTLEVDDYIKFLLEFPYRDELIEDEDEADEVFEIENGRISLLQDEDDLSYYIKYRNIF